MMDFLRVDPERCTDPDYIDAWWDEWHRMEDEYAFVQVPMPPVPGNAPRHAPPGTKPTPWPKPERVAPKPVTTMDDDQLRVVAHGAGPALVMAGAGSGKTRTITSRVAVLARREEAKSILCLTFTRKAASEMRHRIAGEIGADSAKHITISTFHSLALDLIRTSPAACDRQVGFSVWDDDIQKHEIKAIIKQHELASKTKVKGGEWIPAKEVCKALDTVKETCQPLNGKAFHCILSDVHEQAWEIAIAYEELKKACNALDFADLVWLVATQLLDPESSTCATIQSRWKWIIVDEYQDTNAVQELLLDRLSAYHRNLMVVGDEDQCQPDDTKILLPDGSERRLGDIVVGDTVQSYARHEKTLIKSRMVSAIHHRPYSGPLYTITVGDRASRCTPNHKWLVRWCPRAERKSVSLWCTYMMRKGNSFRIGKTTFYRSSGAGDDRFIIGLVLRMRQEGADAGWILKIHDSDMKAAIDEQILSATYGIPEACFLAPKGNQNFTQEALNEIHSSIPNQVDRATTCLLAHGRLLEYPLIDARAPRTRRTVQEIHACNLISDVMSIPEIADSTAKMKNHQENKYIAVWSSPITVSTRHYDGTVCSLDVERDHKYVADGLVTCNSIYAFRGSNVDYIRTFPTRYPGAITYLLGRNYRSTPEIVSSANALISHNKKRNFKTVWSEAKSGAAMNVDAWADPHEEARAIAHAIKNTRSTGVPDTEIAVLVRTRSQFMLLQMELQTRGIPFHIVGDSPWYTRADAKTILAWLRGATNPRDLSAGAAVLASWDGLGNGTVTLWRDSIQSVVAPMFSRLDFLHDKPGLGTHTKRGGRLANFDHAWAEWSSETLHSGTTASLRERVEALLKLLGTTQEIKKGEESESPSEVEETLRRKAFLVQLVESMPAEPGTGQHDGISAWLDALFTSLQNDQKKGGICLSTAHGSKGLEWDYVWLPGWCSGVFPSGRAQSSSAIEEERRLAYVALTRARRSASVSWFQSSSQSSEIPEPKIYTESMFITQMAPTGTKDATWTLEVIESAPVPTPRVDVPEVQPKWTRPEWFLQTTGELAYAVPDDDQSEFPWDGWDSPITAIVLREVTLHSEDDPSRCAACQRPIRVSVALTVYSPDTDFPANIRLGRKCAARILGYRGLLFDATVAYAAIQSIQVPEHAPYARPSRMIDMTPAAPAEPLALPNPQHTNPRREDHAPLPITPPVRQRT